MGGKIVMCPYMGVGHVMPMLMLARNLSKLGFSITFLFPGKELYSRALDKVGEDDGQDNKIVYKVVEFEHEVAGGTECFTAYGLRQVRMESDEYLDIFQSFVYPSLKCIRREVERLIQESPRHDQVACAILDPLLFYAGILVDKLGIPIYSFVPFSATSVACFRHLMLNGFTPGTTSISIPGLIPLPFHEHDFPSTIVPGSQHPRARMHADRNKWMESCCKGLLLNTWDGIERESIVALRDQEASSCCFPKPLAESVHPIGPLLSTSSAFFRSDVTLYARCKEWLDAQIPSSVLLVCFGSWLLLDDEQTEDLAMGLEASRVPFVWVLRSNAFPWLEGLIQRTRGRSLVLDGWAPQQYILSHPSIGGFLMTCGWNSVMESIVLNPRGVVLVAWPLYLDHMPTCRLLVDRLKIAVEVKGSEREYYGLVKREEVSRVAILAIKGLQAPAMRERALALGNAARESIAPGGSSSAHLQAFAQEITRDDAIFASSPVRDGSRESEIEE